MRRFPAAIVSSADPLDWPMGAPASGHVEEARYEASLASRCYEVVDPTKRLVAREIETRWNTALERVAHLEGRIAKHESRLRFARRSIVLR